MAPVDALFSRAFASLASATTNLQDAIQTEEPIDSSSYLLNYDHDARASHRRRLNDASYMLQGRLKRVDEVINSLRNARLSLLWQYAAVQNAAAPMSALPVEILRSIFCAAVLEMGPYGIDVRIAANLSQVCSQWRAIALTTPQLWADLSVVNAITPHYPIALLDAAVERSEGVPRSLSINGSQIHRWSSKLLEHDNVRKTLQTLSISTAYPHRDLYSSINHVFPALQSLDIYIRSGLELAWLDFEDARAVDMPSLTELSLQGVRFETLSPISTTIRKLFFTEVRLDAAWHRLGEDCPNLERLGLRDCTWHNELPLAIMPKLQFLEIDVPEGPGHSRALPVVATTLRYLRLSSTYLLYPLRHILQQYSLQAPNVEQLVLCDPAESIIEILKGMGDDPFLFANLRQITLSWPVSDWPEDEHSSSQVAIALKSLIIARLQTPSSADEETADAMHPFIERVEAPGSVLEHDREWFTAHVLRVVEGDNP